MLLVEDVVDNMDGTLRVLRGTATVVKCKEPRSDLVGNP